MRLKPGTFQPKWEPFVDFATQHRRRVTSVMGTIDHNWATTPRDDTVAPLALYSSGGASDPRLYDTDRGHLFGLEHGGPEHRENIVPMWGHSNRCGTWKKAYQRLAKWFDDQQAHGIAEAVVTITCAYPAANDTGQLDPRIPISIVIQAKAVVWNGQGGAAAPRFHEHVDHGRPVPTSRPDATLKSSLEADQAKMQAANWTIENVIYTDDRMSYRPRPTFPSGVRPYAVLDYRRWLAVQAQYGNDAKSQLQACIAFTKDVQNTSFDEAQREAVLLANRAINGGHIVTDSSDDTVLTALRYRPVGVGNGVLVEQGGSDSAPQVDHIVPESRAGTNAYSNAQVISTAYNMALGAAVAPADNLQQQANLDARTNQRVRKAPDRLGQSSAPTDRTGKRREAKPTWDTRAARQDARLDKKKHQKAQVNSRARANLMDKTRGKLETLAKPSNQH